MNIYALTNGTYGGTDAYTTSPASAAMAGGVLLMMLAVLAVVYVITAWLLGRVFQKAGVEAWKAWVPFYNSYVLFELGGQSGWWTLAMFVPVLNIVAIVFMVMAVHQINLKFGKDVGFTVLYFFFPVIWTAILAFDGSQWNPRRVATR